MRKIKLNLKDEQTIKNAKVGEIYRSDKSYRLIVKFDAKYLAVALESMHVRDSDTNINRLVCVRHGYLIGELEL